MQKKQTLILTGGLILVLVGGALFYRFAMSNRLTCDSSEFITNGMTINEIEHVLGQPSRNVVKNSPDEYRFGQGDLEAKIHEGLIYDLSDGRSMEIYLDTNQIVVGKNCGHG
ncbi:MAG: hypothetical protein AAB473_00870 [Patescibacteria group bacterium]